MLMLFGSPMALPANATLVTSAPNVTLHAYNTTMHSWFGRQLAAKGKGRGKAKGRGKGGGSDLPIGTVPQANERVCYPIPPAISVPKQGQVLEGTSFGAALSAIASLTEVKRVLELGTWYGGGSTVNLARGVRDSAVATLARSLGSSAPTDNCIERTGESGLRERCCHSLVVTVEVFEPAWEHARK